MLVSWKQQQHQQNKQTKKRIVAEIGVEMIFSMIMLSSIHSILLVQYSKGTEKNKIFGEHALKFYQNDFWQIASFGYINNVFVILRNESIC